MENKTQKGICGKYVTGVFIYINYENNNLWINRSYNKTIKIYW